MLKHFRSVRGLSTLILVILHSVEHDADIDNRQEFRLGLPVHLRVIS